MTKNIWVDIEGFEGKYQISDTGSIRTASKKLKKTIQDSRGLNMVVLESADGESVAYYITDLLARNFAVFENADNFNERKVKMLEEKIAELESQLASGVRNKKRVRSNIIEDESGKRFLSFADAAKANNFNYDKFYNAFYTKKRTSVEFEGHTFKIVEPEETETEVETETSDVSA